MNCNEILVYLAFTPILISETSADLVYEMHHRSPNNDYWTYPLNAVVSLVGIALQPLCSAVGIVASAFFALISFVICSEELLGKAIEAFLGAVALIVLSTAVLAIRIFDPDFCSYYDRRRSHYQPPAAQQLPLPQPNIPPPPPVVFPDAEVFDPNFTPGPSSRPQGPMSQFFFQNNQTADQT